jgi:hypothetical protein
MAEGNQMVLHCGARRVSFEELAAVPTPEPEGRWHPVGHARLLTTVLDQMKPLGLEVASQELALSPGNGRFFALIQLAGAHDLMPGVGSMLGIRGSIDKSMADGVCLGSKCFVCDNLAFSAEVSFLTKNTRHILDRLPGLVAGALSRYPAYAQYQTAFFHRMQDLEVTGDAQLHDFVMKAFRADVIPSSQIGQIVEEWFEPEHPEMYDDRRTAWRLFNCFTHNAKRLSDQNPFEQTARTLRLSTLFAQVVGLEPTAN